MTNVDTSSAGADFRRSAPRLKLAIDAVLLGLYGRQKVTLLDLSLRGAQLAFTEPPKERAGFLTWMEFETFGEVAWREGLYVGLKFDRPIPERWLEIAESRVTDADAYRHETLLQKARDWVDGGLDTF